MENLTLHLTLDEINIVLDGLGNMPFKRVHLLIAKIHEQGQRQVVTAEPQIVGPIAAPVVVPVVEQMA